MKKISRIFSFLLAFVMVFSMISLSPVWAEEVSQPERIENSTAENTEQAEAESTESAETSPEDSALLSTRAAYENGKYRPKAAIWNCSNEKISYSYNGVNYTSNRVLMHTVWIDDEFHTAYCIEPGIAIQSGSIYEETEHIGSDPWGLLDYAKQRGVSLAILYGYPNSIDSDDLRTQIAYQLATYLIIHEIILGWRQDSHPFELLNDTYFDVFGGGTPESPEKLQITSEYYSSVHTKYLRNDDVWFAYNYISEKLATHDLIPSFASKIEEQAPSYIMTSNGDGTYSITLTDTNNILSAYDFEDTNDLTFVKSENGQSLTITTSNSDLEPVIVAPTRIIPNAGNSAFLIWNADNGSQDMCTLQSPKYDPVPVYFKLKLPTGNLEIQKETSDGYCLSGWQFDIYRDQACTDLVSKAHTTNPEGQVFVAGLQAGTYWVKETGNTSDTVTGFYYCEENPIQVVITAGETASVSFLNTLIPKGNVAITKTTDTGNDVMGWRFALYADEACETLLYGPVATAPNGIAKIMDIIPGNYWLKEIGHNDPALAELYTCTGRNPVPVTVVQDEYANVTFYNKIKTGTITINKTDPYGYPLSGASFLLEWSSNGSDWKPVSFSTVPGNGNCSSDGLKDGVLATGKDGCVSFQDLYLNVFYRITEVAAPNGYQLLGDYAFQGKMTVSESDVTVNVVNAPEFTLPHTGSRSMIGISAGLALCLLTCVGAVCFLRGKEF